jgi:sialate O-acetylesterase
VEKKIEGTDVVTTGWHESTNENVNIFSAVAYYFGKELRKNLGVPVGLVHSSWGGSRIEPWTDPDMYLKSPVFAKEAAVTPLSIDGMQPGKNFRGMIEPMIPFAIKGAIWYQGESNLMIHDEWRYADKMQLLIEGWRKDWGYDFPFYYVQLAPHLYSARKDALSHPTDYLPFYWEIQQAVQAIPKTGMVFITDLVNDLGNIHPVRKVKVGQRLALWALTKDYKQKGITYRSPQFKSMKIRGNTVEISFSETAGGLVYDGEQPLWFSIAGVDGNFVPAKASVSKDKVTVWSDTIASPTMVRYAWDETAQTNLFGGTGLPVAPFRSNPETWKRN